MSARVPLGALVEAPIVLDAPYGKFHVNRLDDIDHAGMRAEQLREVLTLMSDSDKSHLMLRLAKQLAGEVVDRTKPVIEDHANSEGLVAASLFTSEVSEFLLTIELDAGPGIMLWLAQQLCDELSGTLRGMNREVLHEPDIKADVAPNAHAARPGRSLPSRSGRAVARDSGAIAIRQ